jgi:hypothetical protein
MAASRYADPDDLSILHRDRPSISTPIARPPATSRPDRRDAIIDIVNPLDLEAVASQASNPL